MPTRIEGVNSRLWQFSCIESPVREWHDFIIAAVVKEYWRTARKFRRKILRARQVPHIPHIAIRHRPNKASRSEKSRQWLFQPSHQKDISIRRSHQGNARRESHRFSSDPAFFRFVFSNSDSQARSHAAYLDRAARKPFLEHGAKTRPIADQPRKLPLRLPG
jgi:hypothetical protein